MYRTLCVLAVLTLQAGLAHPFSWDIVMATRNRLIFYNDEKLTYSVTFTEIDVDWITYDPFHNRVLLMDRSTSLLSYDIATGKKQTLIDFQMTHSEFAYDPVTDIFFAKSGLRKMYSYLVKPGSDHEANLVIDLGGSFHSIAVDSCGGYIYWIREADKSIERARLDGSEREKVIGRSDLIRSSLTIDPQTQNMYWTEFQRDSRQYLILSANLNGKHGKILHHGQSNYPPRLTVSKDFIYWTESYIITDDKIFWKFPKNLPFGRNVEPKGIAFNDTPTESGNRFIYIAANYAIEEQPKGTALCEALKRLLPNYSATNDSDSLNVSTGGSLLPVNETTVRGESRVTGDVSVCHNYCLQGNCSVSAEGQPDCRCNAGYSGVRCEVHECHSYCLNDGVCILSEQNNPVCQCTGGYQGERCDVPIFLIKCSQTVSLLKDILNTDLTSVTEGKGVKSTTCASTVV